MELHARGGRGLPSSFSKIGKKCPNLGKKCPDCIPLWAKFNIQNAIFKSFQAKKPKIFPCGIFLSRVVGECLSKCPNCKKTTLPSKKFLVTRQETNKKVGIQKKETTMYHL